LLLSAYDTSTTTCICSPKSNFARKLQLVLEVIDCHESNGDLADFVATVLCVLDLPGLNSFSNRNLLFYDDADNENRGKGGKRGNDVVASMNQQRRLFLIALAKLLKRSMNFSLNAPSSLNRIKI
jgi:hypothetical protein